MDEAEIRARTQALADATVDELIESLDGSRVTAVGTYRVQQDIGELRVDVRRSLGSGPYAAALAAMPPPAAELVRQLLDEGRPAGALLLDLLSGAGWLFLVLRLSRSCHRCG
jgi:hypothetical protein